MEKSGRRPEVVADLARLGVKQRVQVASSIEHRLIEVTLRQE